MKSQITWLTVKEAAAYLRCSRPTLYKYIRELKLTTSKLVGKTLIGKESVDTALEQKSITNPMNSTSSEEVSATIKENEKFI